MNQVFKPFLRRFVIIFFDDILVYSRSESKHLKHLQKVLDCLRTHQFFAKFLKCQFFQSTIEYLGHLVSQGSVHADPHKISAMLTWPIPRTLK